jgi:peptide/nickel transport system substrate-binding protein
MRMRRHQVVTISEQTDRHFFRRFEHLLQVRRFVSAWLFVAVLLLGTSFTQIYSLGHYYQSLQPERGGMYTEGVIGAFTNANPIYAATLADRTVSKLLFSGLLTYDTNNQLVGDLAESWTADARGQSYTVTLRPNIVWHDGRSVTSEDVVFTYTVIQNPDAQSPLNQSWQNVKVEAVDTRTVKFTLTNPLASFPHAMTNGIVPKHILGDTAMLDLRTSPFNTSRPIGSGPFLWQDVSILGSTSDQREEVVMTAANKQYHLGQPKLDNFAVHAFRTPERMLESYNNHELHAMVGLNQEPEGAKEQMNALNFRQTAAVMAFFKNTAPPFTEKVVRQALVQAIDTDAVRKQLGYPARAVQSPFLKGQLGYDATVTQLVPNVVNTQSLLASAGYVAGPKGVLEKAGQPLAFSVTAEDTPENRRVAVVLQRQWQQVGADVRLLFLTASELQVGLATHDYDVLLRGISIGVDPDVFVYWHSNQADIAAPGRLNFSEYKSKAADESLELGRTRTDASLRAAKYKPFLTSWRDDAPALGLYQPRFLYITRQPVYGLESRTVSNASDRLNNVQDWMIRRVKTAVE